MRDGGSASGANGGVKRLVIGGLTIDTQVREASRNGFSQRLRPQDLKVLQALAERRGVLVTRQDLVDLCWGGRIVGEDVINHSISMLRKLADSAGGFEIETVPRAGYRLVETDVSAVRLNRRPLLMALMAALAALAVAIVWLDPAYRLGKPPMPSVALIPISFDVSDPRTRRLALATDDSLAHLLRDSGFTPRRLAVRPASGAAPADLIIDGSIRATRDGAEASIRVEETRNGMTIFAKRVAAAWLESSSLPDRVGAKIATNLNWTGALMILDRRQPLEPQIIAELLKQLSMLVEDEDYLRAYEISNRIAPLAPRSAIAQVSLAFTTGFILGELPSAQRRKALELGRAAARRSLVLAPDFGDAYVPWCLLHSPMRRIECESRMREGLAADPDAPFVAAFLANFLHRVGRSEEALEFARKSLADDPYKPAKMTLLVRLLEATGRIDEADQLYRRTRHYWPDYPGLEWSRAIGILERKDFAALSAFKRSLPDSQTPHHRSAVAFAEMVASADRSAARRLCPFERILTGSSGQCMVALADIGDLDGAFAVADMLFPDLRAASNGEEDRLWLDRPLGAPESLLTGPSGVALRRDPRFLAVAKRIGLLRYWRSSRLPDFCRNRPEPVCAKLVTPKL